MKKVSLFDLIHEAKEMLLDRIPIERELIYSIASLTDEERSAIVLAYQFLQEEGESVTK